jgi:hypothetical protein
MTCERHCMMRKSIFRDGKFCCIAASLDFALRNLDFMTRERPLSGRHLTDRKTRVAPRLKTGATFLRSRT